MATPAQTSANSTGWSLKKLPTNSVPTPSQSLRRVTSARAGFYHMGRPRAPPHGSGSGFVLVQRTRELERRERAAGGLLSRQSGLSPPFDASAYASWRFAVACLQLRPNSSPTEP